MSSSTAAVHALIQQVGGWVSFARYLEIALHHPHLGFYGGGRVNFGAAGDFITAPMLSPLFGRMLARQAAQIIRHCGGDILELGAGDGQLAATILESLPEDIKCRYFILETSAALRARQQQALADKVQWLDALPDSFNGVVIANEVLDALPFSLFVKRDGEWRLRGVQAAADGVFCWRDVAAPDDFMRRRLEKFNLPDNYQTEINPRAEALTQTLCRMMQRGVVLFADYGFGRAEYYHPQRDGGTMMCHRAQLADDNPLESPGDKDITAHVDFTAIADAGLEGGAQLAGYTTQAYFLLNCGIAEYLQQQSEKCGAGDYAKLAAGAQKLLAPQEMGELFKFIAFAKGALPPLNGFGDGDRRRQL